jgi:TonB family protein
MSVLTRFFNLFRLTSLDRELDEELRFHLAERARRNAAAGMSRQDAEAAALDRFGSVARAKAGMRAAHVAARPMVAVSVLTIVMIVGGALGTAVYRSGSGQRVYDISAEVTAPVPVVTPHPEYTAAAKRAKIQGSVRVRCVVRPEGVCADVTVIRSLDRTFGLDDEALRALRDWRFRPALRAGGPVATRVDFEIRFTLR